MTDLELMLIYASVPPVSCKGLCIKACGPIRGTVPEREYFERKTGKPFPDAFKMLKTGNTTCPHLDLMGRCSVYAYRPLICRLWGATPEMTCPWGCRPREYLTETQVTGLMRRAIR